MKTYWLEPSNQPSVYSSAADPYRRHLVRIVLCYMSNVVYLKDRRGPGMGGVMGAGWVSLRNWRRHPPVTFYSLTLADYRQLMHNKYTPLRVHYHLINISLWRERVEWDWVESRGFCVTDVVLRLRGTDWNQTKQGHGGRVSPNHFASYSFFARLQRLSWSSAVFMKLHPA